MRWADGLRSRCGFLWSLRLVMSFGMVGIALLFTQAHAQMAPASAVPEALQTAPNYDLPGSALRSSADLPDSPGTVLHRRMMPANSAELAELDSGSGPASDKSRDQSSEAAKAKASDTIPPGPCSAASPRNAARTPEAGRLPAVAQPALAQPARPPASGAAPATKPLPPCPPSPNPYQRFLNSTTPIPLTPRQKAHLAVHNFIDPGNIVTILGTSAIAIASDSHTAYGPGLRGFGRNAGISAVEDATGDFFGTFLIPSIAHEDPHYHRMPNASIPKRTLHAISRTVIAQGDDGHAMLNYATLLNYPITAEIANLYVPGVASNGPSTVERVLTGYATDPIDNLITEFLPDVAKRVHVRVIFVQQIINQVAAGQPVSVFP